MTLDRAADFTLTHVTGREVSLGEYRGRQVVILFGGQGSQNQMESIVQALRERYTHEEVPLITIPDLHTLPGMFHPIARGRLVDLYKQAAQNEAAQLRQKAKSVPEDLSEVVVIAPDWSGEVVASFGVSGADRQATAVVIDDAGSIKGRASGPGAAERVVALLSGK